MKFTKMHGTGNDYIYVNGFEEKLENPSEAAVKLSDRRFGIGSDGLILILPSDVADCRMEMFNADGSIGKMCGNGIRCVAKYVYDRGLVKKDVLRVETRSGVKTLQLRVEDGKVASVRVNMGQPELDPEKIPVLFSKDRMVDEEVYTPSGNVWRVTCVSMGNPHGVIFLDEPVETFELTKYGSALECHPAFPKKVNIEFVNVLSEKRLRMRVWERGSGVTLACGTGSCAALVAANLCGLAGREAEIELDGGTLLDRWDEPTGRVLRTGPAAFVFNGEYEA